MMTLQYSTYLKLYDRIKNMRLHVMKRLIADRYAYKFELLYF